MIRASAIKIEKQKEKTVKKKIKKKKKLKSIFAHL